MANSNLDIASMIYYYTKLPGEIKLLVIVVPNKKWMGGGGASGGALNNCIFQIYTS
jgi:hypothetical protein